MTDYDNNNRGVLFKNDKGDNPNRPDYKGRITVNNEEYWLACWVKKSKQGEMYMSLSVQEMEDKYKERNRQQRHPQDGGQADFDDEIPF